MPEAPAAQPDEQLAPSTLLMVLGTIFFWSSAFPAISFGLEHFSPGELSLGRFSIASICFLILMAAGVIHPPPRKHLPMIALLGAIGIAAYQLLLGIGMTTVTAGAASILIALSPAVTAALAAWRLGEPLTRRMLISLGIALTGAVTVTLGAGETVRFEPLALLIFVSVLCTSFYFVFQKPLLREMVSLDFTAASIIAGTIALIPFGLGLPGKLVTASSAQLLSVLWLGLAPSFIGYLLWNLALSKAPAGKVSMFLYAQPVIAASIAWVWLGQVPTVLTALGGVILIFGVILGTATARKNREERAASR